MATAAETITVTLDRVRELTVGALMACGADEVNAEAVAEVVVKADRDGCASHGLFRVPGYCASLKSGRTNGRADPRVEDRAPGVVKVWGDNGFAPLPTKRGRPLLAEKARACGIAALVIQDSAHFAALWPDTEPLAEHGLIGMSFVNSRSFVAPAGGKRRLFGTNPMSFAVPRGDGRPPMVFDQASAAMARGEIMIAARDGHTLPAGAGLGPDGQPTTDPAQILKGVQLAFGGYKGAAIAMMVEILAAGLSGGEFSFEAEAAYNGDGGPSNAGHMLIALDPVRFDARFAERAETLFAMMLADEGVRLPGDRRLANRARTPVEGVTLPKALHDEVAAIAEGR